MFEALNNLVPPVTQILVEDLLYSMDCGPLFQILNIWEMHTIPLIQNFPRGICTIRSCGYLTFDCSRGILIKYLIKLAYFAWFIHVFDLPTCLYYPILASIQPTHHLFFGICQVSYNSSVSSKTFLGVYVPSDLVDT